MPRHKRTHTISRLNLEMSLQSRQRLEQLRQDTDADSLVDMIRKAVDLYEHVIQAQARGEKIVSRGPEGERELVFL